ncbi:amino acid ABC transporter membrane protein 2, PAAT family [Shimia gijangensis]|uniref:Amino acid ABC transporter membrane protein 2, PAAT family n=1 Tax=Shimia gijangensis TaxID=1470563 RepID=A0A1M6U0W0_9RHOB|nr:amino acid ABC transporter permease [Shimia gijangensis]SHK62836.1 amino acid ABC transporter membrane protein 2, PAAT family [Shimia gijangensis]
MAIITATKTPDRAAPLGERSVIGWIHKNLFSSWFNAILTLLTGYLVFITVTGVFNWGFTDATFVAENRRACYDNSLTGACWAGVIDWLDNIFYGRYPRDQIWRINVGAVLLVLWMAPLWMGRVKGKVLVGTGVVVFYPFLAGYLFSGGDKGLFMQVMVSGAIVALIANTANMLTGVLWGEFLPDFVLRVLGKSTAPDKTQRNILLALLFVVFTAVFVWQLSWTVEFVSWTKWGGLFLTMVISGIGIASSLPGGILLALGRRSKLTVVRVLCVAFIEVFRSVPLITVLFMATTMFPLFMPEGFVLNKLVQVIIAVILFNACYMAETVRAGLQAIPKGQYEAAHTIGLGYWRTTGLIIMPQALKHMIPNIVGSFIGLLKDTTLVSIIGLFDILGMLRSISKDMPWLGLHKEPLIFGAFLFFVLCFSMSKYSRHLEVKLSAGDQH